MGLGRIAVSGPAAWPPARRPTLTEPRANKRRETEIVAPTSLCKSPPLSVAISEKGPARVLEDPKLH